LPASHDKERAVPLDRRGRPPAEPRQSSKRRRLSRDVEVEYVENGLDWLAERVEPADEQEETTRLPAPAAGTAGAVGAQAEPPPTTEEAPLALNPIHSDQVGDHPDTAPVQAGAGAVPERAVPPPAVAPAHDDRVATAAEDDRVATAAEGEPVATGAQDDRVAAAAHDDSAVAQAQGDLAASGAPGDSALSSAHADRVGAQAQGDPVGASPATEAAAASPVEAAAASPVEAEGATAERREPEVAVEAQAAGSEVPAADWPQDPARPEEEPWFSPAVQALRQAEADEDHGVEPTPGAAGPGQRLEPGADPQAPAQASAPAAAHAAQPPSSGPAAEDPRLAPAIAEAGPEPPVPTEPLWPGYDPERPAGQAGPGDEPLPGWDDLTSERLLARQPGGPTEGWQGLVYRLTNGRVRPQPGRAERARRKLEARVRAPIYGYRRIAVLALKGGVGKTTTTACLGATFATHRPDRVVAVDASPDAGTLGGRTRGDGIQTAKGLLASAPPLDRYADVRGYAAQTSSGLEVVASELDPSMSHPFSDADYRKVAAILERFYSLILTDCGPGVLHTVMLAVLERADQLVVVSAPSVDGARSASLTLDWLEQHGFEAQARSAVVVVNSVRPRGPVNIGQLEEHFSRRCRAVVRIPFDHHLETGAEIEMDQLAPETRHAYARLAAAVADGFGDEVQAHSERLRPGWPA
jgi:MinD-like ATPase involved in chromosome partitioning or flagellar assembly